MVISPRYTLSLVPQEKLLVKFCRQYHAPMNITSADNPHKFDSRHQATSHSNSPRILLFNLAHKQCGGIIKVNRKISYQQYINAWLNMMSGHGAYQFCLITKIKIGRPEHSLPPNSLRPITFHFCLTHLHPLKWTSYVYHLWWNL